MRPPFRIEPLKAQDRKGFSCDVLVLDRYFQEQVTQDLRRRVSNCFVALDAEGTIAAFYTFAATSLPLNDLSPAETKRLPRYPMLPAGLIGRLAVGSAFKGRGLGGALIFDAVERAMRSDPAIFALVVDAKDDVAAAFYRRFGFQPFASRPLSLYLPMATALKALIEA